MDPDGRKVVCDKESGGCTVSEITTYQVGIDKANGERYAIAMDAAGKGVRARTMHARYASVPVTQHSINNFLEGKRFSLLQEIADNRGSPDQFTISGTEISVNNQESDLAFRNAMAAGYARDVAVLSATTAACGYLVKICMGASLGMGSKQLYDGDYSGAALTFGATAVGGGWWAAEARLAKGEYNSKSSHSAIEQ